MFYLTKPHFRESKTDTSPYKRIFSVLTGKYKFRTLKNFKVKSPFECGNGMKDIYDPHLKENNLRLNV